MLLIIVVFFSIALQNANAQNIKSQNKIGAKVTRSAARSGAAKNKVSPALKEGMPASKLATKQHENLFLGINVFNSPQNPGKKNGPSKISIPWFSQEPQNHIPF